MKPSLPLLKYIMALATCLTLTQCTVPAGGGSGSLPPATKAQPFVNSLGMKFVPVPGTNILMCTTETTVAQYQAAGRGYQAPGFPQGSNHPAVNVSWNDAKTWCAWLNKREGRKYRLPTDAEWSAAVSGSTYPWGNQWPPPNNCGNYMGQEHRSSARSKNFLSRHGLAYMQISRDFRDWHDFTAPVASYPANGHGIHDLGGNVSEWCRKTSSGSAHVLKGGAWCSSGDFFLQSSFQGIRPDYLGESGFRIVVVP